jgi:hypothetical protein
MMSYLNQLAFFSSFIFLAFSSNDAFGLGVFDFYNTIDEATQCYISVTGEQSGKTVQSPKLVGFKKKWTTELRGGRYRIKIWNRNWTKDLGWIDVGDRKSGIVYLGWSDEVFRLEIVKDENGRSKEEWVAYKATPINKHLQARLYSSSAGLSDSVQETERKPKLGVNVTLCKDGIHVQSNVPNSPATRCEITTGGTWSIDPGEHILRVNGATPQSVEQFQEMIRTSDRIIGLDVLDSNGRVIQMTAELW